MLEVVYGVFHSACAWPTFQYVAAQIWGEFEQEPRDLYYELSGSGLVRPLVEPSRPFELRDNTTIRLSLRGLSSLSPPYGELETFLRIVRYVGDRSARWRPVSPTEAQPLEISSGEISTATGAASDSRQLLLLHEYAPSIWTGLSGPQESGAWSMTVEPERARRFRQVSSVADFEQAEAAVHGAHTGSIRDLRLSLEEPGLEEEHDQVPTTSDSPGPVRARVASPRSAHHAPVKLSNQTIAAIAKPFEGGGGCSHSTIDLVFSTADATEYLGEGNKLNKVLGGLQSLRDGRGLAAHRPELPPDHEKLQAVAADLATRLLASGLVDTASVREALGPSGESQRSSPPRRSTPVVDAQPHSEDRELSAVRQGSDSAVADPRVVMVVHGQDDEAQRAMFDWLRSIDLMPRQWSQHVKASEEGSPFIGKVLEAAFATAQAVVILFTPDERVQLREALAQTEPGWRLQARPNVLFEAGMAFATHPKRSVLVVLGEQDLPSDVAGRHYVRLGSVSAVRDLAQRLENAGCPVDLSGDDWLDVGRFPNRSGISATPDTVAAD